MKKRIYQCVTGLEDAHGYVPAYTRKLLFFKSSAKSERGVRNAAMKEARRYWQSTGYGTAITPTVMHIREIVGGENL